MERLRERRKYQNSMPRSGAGKGSARDGSQVSAQTGPQMDRELKEIRDRKWCFGSNVMRSLLDLLTLKGF